MTFLPFKRNLKLLAILLGAYFALSAVLVTVVDPWRYNQAPWTLNGVFDTYRDVTDVTRIGKATLANYGDWTVVIMGSSRVEMGINPEHPVFANERAVNLAMQAAFVFETIPATRYVLERNPGIKTLIFGFEVGDFSQFRDIRHITRFNESPFADGGHSIERDVGCVIGWESVQASLATVGRWITGTEPVRNHRGFWTKPKDPVNIRTYTERVERKKRRMVSIAQWGDIPDDPRLQLMYDEFRQLMIDVREAGIEMHVILTPQHAIKMMNKKVARPERMAWGPEIELIAGLCKEANEAAVQGPPVKFWSFLTFNPMTTEPIPEPGPEVLRMNYWYDLGHFRAPVGDAVLQTMFGSREDDTFEPIGIELTGRDWESVEREWIDDHARYHEERADDVAWINSIVTKD